tara:strand:- start:24 stop:272 length:249 start_codon:yes stop_codon:yes gene_type:complete
MNVTKEYKKITGPLLLEGYGLQKNDGRLSICMHTHTGSAISEPLGILKWSYEMFEDGIIQHATDDDIYRELDAGGRIIIVQI